MGPVAYDEDLAQRIRELVASEPGCEKRMFGGLAFLIGGNMAVSASGQGGLLVRVDPEETDALLDKPHAEPFVMRGRAMQGWLGSPPRASAPNAICSAGWPAGSPSPTHCLPSRRGALLALREAPNLGLPRTRHVAQSARARQGSSQHREFERALLHRPAYRERPGARRQPGLEPPCGHRAAPRRLGRASGPRFDQRHLGERGEDRGSGRAAWGRADRDGTHGRRADGGRGGPSGARPATAGARRATVATARRPPPPPVAAPPPPVAEPPQRESAVRRLASGVRRSQSTVIRQLTRTTRRAVTIAVAAVVVAVGVGVAAALGAFHPQRRPWPRSPAACSPPPCSSTGRAAGRRSRAAAAGSWTRPAGSS